MFSHRSGAVIAAVACGLGLLAPAQGRATATQRFLPAPPGKTYLMVFAGSSAFSEFKSSEMALVKIPLQTDPPTYYKLGSTWEATAHEIGLNAGYGLGSLLFLKSMDFSVYVPVYFRSYKLNGFIATDAPRSIAGLPQTSLHDSLREAPDGKGFGDLQLSTMALLYGDAEIGMWSSAACRIALPTAPSTHERFVRILHGSAEAPGGGDGVARLIPALSLVKTVAGQRAYLSLEYSLPLRAEKFSFQSPQTESPFPVPDDVLADSDKVFNEEIKLGGALMGTIGMETSLDLFGVNPGVEVNFRQIQRASWKENGADGTAQPAAPGYPIHTPEFLRAGAWAVGNMTLKNNTEIEIGLTGTSRLMSGDVVKVGVSYISNVFGHSFGFRVAFVNMFVERPQDERGVPGKPEAREVEFSPTLDAPPAPTGRISLGVSFPASGAAVKMEEAEWVARQLRAAVKRLRGYDFFPEKAMAQLGSDPCGEADCGARFGRALKLQAFIVSRLDRVGDPAAPAAEGFTLSVKLVNVEDGTVASSESISGLRLDDISAQLPDLLKRLTAQPAAPPAN